MKSRKDILGHEIREGIFVAFPATSHGQLCMGIGIVREFNADGIATLVTGGRSTERYCNDLIRIDYYDVDVDLREGLQRKAAITAPKAASFKCGRCRTTAGCERHRTFKCQECKRPTHWDDGGADERPNDCSDCWLAKTTVASAPVVP